MLARYSLAGEALEAESPVPTIKSVVMEYRFKTIEEFTKEFGSNWRNLLRAGWGAEMDVLAGQNINGRQPSETEYGTHFASAHWSVSLDMTMPLDPDAAAAASKRVDYLSELMKRFRFRGSDRGAESPMRYLYYKDPYDIEFEVSTNCTGNCQLLSVHHLNALIARDTFRGQYLKDVLLCAARFAGTGKILAFVDVKENYLSVIKEIAYTEPTPYLSTNGSKMCYALIKLT